MCHLFCCCIIQGVSFHYHHKNVRSWLWDTVSNFQVSVSAFMTKSRSRLEIWARSRSRRLRSRLHHWWPLHQLLSDKRQNSHCFCLLGQNRQYQLYWLMCNWFCGFGFGLDIGVHNFIFSDMESMKKFRIGSGLQNFHIRTPLVGTRGVRTQVFSSPTPVLISEVGILIRILFATQLWNLNPEKILLTYLTNRCATIQNFCF